MRLGMKLSLAALTLAAGMIACSSPAPDDEVEGSASKVTRFAFDKNAVLDDVSLGDVDAMNADDMQAFLEETPWGTRSALADYTSNGKTAARIMHDAAVKYGINPLELLVRAQMEQGLVSKTEASDDVIDIAFGCGCPHSPVCSDRYMGFENQADCAAGTLSRSMARAVTSTGTVSGWARSRAKETEDGLMITPKNAATAALYTYTPWVGEAGGGREGVGGASLHFAVWDRFATSVGYGAWAPAPAQSPRGAGTDAGADATPSAPTDDAGAPSETEETEEPSTPAADAGAEEAPPREGEAPPSDGSDDDELLGEGNAPPSSNGPPPKSSSPGRHAPEDLPYATEEELAGKPKASSGCSTSGAGAHGDAAIVALAIAAGAGASRRRRRRAGV